MALDNIFDLFAVSLKDIYSGENQLVDAMPKMAGAATSLSLKEGFGNHLKETEVQVERLEKIADILEIELDGNECEAMSGLIKEGGEFVGIEGSPSVIDLGLIAAAQKIEHYEIAGYLSAMALADIMGFEEVSDLLAQTLEEEVRTDEKLQMIAEDELYPLAIETLDSADIEEEDDSEDESDEDEKKEEETEEEESKEEEK